MTTQSFRCQPDCPLISVSEAWHLVESLVCALKRLPSCMTKVPPIPGFLWAHGLRPWHDPRVGHLPVSWFENRMSNLLYPSSFDSYPRQNCRFLNDGCDIRHVRMCMLPPTCSLFCQRQMVLPNENVALCFFLFAFVDYGSSGPLTEKACGFLPGVGMPCRGFQRQQTVRTHGLCAVHSWLPGSILNFPLKLSTLQDRQALHGSA